MKTRGGILSRLWNKGDRVEKISALVVLALFLTLFFLIPTQVPMKGLPGPDIGYSPRLFPYTGAVLGIIVGLGLLVRSFFVGPAKKATTTSAALGTSASETIIELRSLLRVGGLFAILVSYVLLLSVLGAILALMLLLITSMWYFGFSFRKGWKIAVPLVILFPLLIYYIFKMLLYVALPAGVLAPLLYMIGWY